MWILYLLALVWVGYGVWFSYDMWKEIDEADKKWWTPPFYFVVGLFAAIMIVVEFIEENFDKALREIRKRQDKKGER